LPAPLASDLDDGGGLIYHTDGETMQYKCDRCGRPATIYLTEISDGKKLEKHLCEECAVAEGVAMKADIPISQLLEDFVLHSTGAKNTSRDEADSKIACDVCGMTWERFREEKVLGCPHDYDVFEQQLRPILLNEQEGACQHIGKVPHRAGNDQRKQNAVLRLRAQLNSAIAQEDYERAAALRDQIRELESL